MSLPACVHVSTVQPPLKLILMQKSLLFRKPVKSFQTETPLVSHRRTARTAQRFGVRQPGCRSAPGRGEWSSSGAPDSWCTGFNKRLGGRRGVAMPGWISLARKVRRFVDFSYQLGSIGSFALDQPPDTSRTEVSSTEVSSGQTDDRWGWFFLGGRFYQAKTSSRFTHHEAPSCSPKEPHHEVAKVES